MDRTETRVEVCDKCGVVFASSAGEDHGHDLIPCPLCHVKWELEKKLLNEQTAKFDLLKVIDTKDTKISELVEQIKDLQEQIDDIYEELE